MKFPKARRNNVAAHSYDTKTKSLTVTFHNGRTYRYAGVPTERALKFGGAQSRGQFLHEHIIPNHEGTELFDD